MIKKYEIEVLAGRGVKIGRKWFEFECHSLCSASVDEEGGGAEVQNENGRKNMVSLLYHTETILKITKIENRCHVEACQKFVKIFLSKYHFLCLYKA